MYGIAAKSKLPPGNFNQDISPAGNVPTTERRPLIEEVMSGLEKDVHLLSENLARLTSRIEPVLGPSMPQEAMEKTCSEYPVAMANRLKAISRQISGLSCHVCDLHNRVEI